MRSGMQVIKLDQEESYGKQALCLASILLITVVRAYHCFPVICSANRLQLCTVRSNQLRTFTVSADCVQGKRVVELGCGTGVVGVTMACLGAQVVLTDRQSILKHAQHNINSNDKLIQAAGGSAAVLTLEWGSPSVASSPELQQVHVIAGADLIYAQKDITPLCATLRELLAENAHCDILIGHKDRNADVTQRFLDEAQAIGINLHSVKTTGAVSVYKRA